jgi:hypothetical protein
MSTMRSILFRCFLDVEITSNAIREHPGLLSEPREKPSEARPIADLQRSRANTAAGLSLPQPGAQPLRRQGNGTQLPMRLA